MIRLLRCFVAAFVSAACVLALCSCTYPQATDAQEDPVAANRQYMSSLNQMSVNLESKLQGFAEAVSRNDTVSMRTQADSAFQVIDAMRDTEAPEDLTGLRDGYMEACDDLEDALNSYIDLYEEVSSAQTPMDRDAYDARIKEVQDKYGAAVTKLEETDKTATELQK